MFMFMEPLFSYEDDEAVERLCAGLEDHMVQKAKMVFTLEDLRNFVDYMEAEMYLHKDAYGEFNESDLHWQDLSPLFKEGDSDVILKPLSDGGYARVKEVISK